MRRTLFAALLLGLSLIATPRALSGLSQPPPFYHENPDASNPIRTQQVRELDAYIQHLKTEPTRRSTLFKFDYRSPDAFVRSTRRLRETVCRSIGYPPPGDPDPTPPTFERIGEDTLGIYHRVRIPVLPGVHCVGLYIVPKNAKGRTPLVIAMHGGAGSPELALFYRGNYNDMVRGGIQRGYVVFAPTHLFHAEGYPKDIRNRTDDRLRVVGTSLTAVEIAKITRALDVLLKRPEVDPKRVAMIGLSYGGFYTLMTTALEPRIKMAVSSCYFGVQEGRYAEDELSIPSDFRFMDRMTLWRDQDVVALICPRPLEIQAGSKDYKPVRETGKQISTEAAEYYKRLGKGDQFRFLLFEGGHEFHDPTAWEWVQKHL